MMERELWVYTDRAGQPIPTGRLFFRSRGRNQTASFAYFDSWLARRDAFAIDPHLPLHQGSVYHTAAHQAMFGALRDTAPDRWGRNLMRRDERRQAWIDKRQPQTLLEVDFLLRVHDEARQGALRLALPEQPGVFQAPPDTAVIPPLVNLPRLLGAAQHVQDEQDDDADLKSLLAPGSSLGGARPKASIRLPDGTLAIAKFPDKDDDYNVARWESVALDLAARAGIPTPPHRVERVGSSDVLILERFDRDEQGRRIPYLSAMSLVGADDHQDKSYLEIVDSIGRHGGQPKADKADLWRRVVFNVLVNNVDDHLRNHGLLHTPDGWTLAPVFDLNPVPVDIKPRVLATAIGIEDDTASLELAMAQADYFGLGRDRAAAIAGEVGAAVAYWRPIAEQQGIPANQIRRMASAFDHADLKQATAYADQ